MIYGKGDQCLLLRERGLGEGRETLVKQFLDEKRNRIEQARECSIHQLDESEDTERAKLLRPESDAVEKPFLEILFFLTSQCQDQLVQVFIRSLVQNQRVLLGARRGRRIHQEFERLGVLRIHKRVFCQIDNKVLYRLPHLRCKVPVFPGSKPGPDQ